MRGMLVVFLVLGCAKNVQVISGWCFEYPKVLKVKRGEIARIELKVEDLEGKGYPRVNLVYFRGLFGRQMNINMKRQDGKFLAEIDTSDFGSGDEVFFFFEILGEGGKVGVVPSHPPTLKSGWKELLGRIEVE